MVAITLSSSKTALRGPVLPTVTTVILAIKRERRVRSRLRGHLGTKEDFIFSVDDKFQRFGSIAPGSRDNFSALCASCYLSIGTRYRNGRCAGCNDRLRLRRLRSRLGSSKSHPHPLSPFAISRPRASERPNAGQTLPLHFPARPSLWSEESLLKFCATGS